MTRCHTHVQTEIVAQQSRNKVSEKSLSSLATIQMCFETVAQEFRDAILRVSVFHTGYGKYDTKLQAVRLIIIRWSLVSHLLACWRLS